jgi:DNA-binding response OmpR family regulator
MGADLYLIKPVDTNRLLDHVRDAVDESKAAESL